MVPHLTTSLTGPLHELERVVLDQRPEIERWFRTQWLEHEVPFYASVDLRNSGFKLAPVDTNLFPGGFNNLNPEFLPLCVHAAMSAVQKICPDARRFLLVPENHTRNLHYLQNVAVLKRILEGAGLRCASAAYPRPRRSRRRSTCRAARTLVLEPIQRNGNRVGLEGLRSLRGAAQQRPVGRHPADPARHRAADRAAARRRLDHAAQVASLPRLRPRGRGVRASCSASTPG